MFFSRCLVVCLFVLSFSTQHLFAQDVAVYSQYSDSLNKAIKQEVDKLSLVDFQEALGVDTVMPISEKYEQLKDEEFNFSVDEAERGILNLYKKYFATQVSELAKTSDADISNVLTQVKIKLKADFKAKRTEILAPLLEAAEVLQKEHGVNTSTLKKLTGAVPGNLQDTIQRVFRNVEKTGLQLMKATQEPAVMDIKKEASELMIEKAQKAFPDLNLATLQAEAGQKFKYFKVGETVKIKYAPTPNRILTVSGPIRSMDSQRVKISFNTISIKDIVDPLQRLAMSKSETLKRREVYVKEKITEQRNKRQQFFNDKLQAEVDLLVTANEKKGYILNLGTWKFTDDVVKVVLKAQISKLKEAGITKFEKMAIKHSQKMASLSELKKQFSKDLLTLRDKIEKELDSDAVIAKAQAAQTALELSEKEAEEALVKELEEKAKEQAAALAAEKKEKAERQAAIEAKRASIKNQNQKAEESDSSVLIIALAITAILLLAFVAFNKKVHDKILGNKKQSMAEIVNQDAILAHQAMPKPDSNQVPVGPRGSMAPQAIKRPSAGKPDVDVDISVEMTDADQNKTVERKKIALNLKGSTTSLEKDLLNPPSTPPGGGLTPPKVSTSPSEAEVDKSNLILNPNLQAGVQKLQLKK